MPVQCPDIQAPGRLLFGTLSGLFVCLNTREEDRRHMIGPPLDGIGRRAIIGDHLANSPDAMEHWIRDPRGGAALAPPCRT